jgi:hypothetical protein
MSTYFPTGREHNFRKYNEGTVTSFGVEYDYGSIMHYSAHAFSWNGKPTITPLVCMSRRHRSILYSIISVVMLFKSMIVSVIKCAYLNIPSFKFYGAVTNIYYFWNFIHFGHCPCSVVLKYIT